MLHDWCYAVDVYDEHQTLVNVIEIETRLRAVVKDVEARLERGERAIPIGVLSADDRDVWAKVDCFPGLLQFLILMARVESTIPPITFAYQQICPPHGT
jgi:hypothetical protein